MNDQTTRTVLLLEDDENLLHSLAFILRGRGFEVLTATTGEEGLEVASRHRVDLALLDIGLPGIDGLEVARRLARWTPRPRLVMLTGHGLEDEVVGALETVADDYIVKPVRPRVLLARICAVLRRPGATAALPPDSEVYRCGELRVDAEGHEAWLEGELVPLTRTEYDMLLTLLRSPGKVLSRRELIEAVHGNPTAVSERSVDFQIHGLRHKLGDFGSRIVTVRGVGFKLLGA